MRPDRAGVSRAERQVPRCVGGVDLGGRALAAADGAEFPVAGADLVPAGAIDRVDPPYRPVDPDDPVFRQLADVPASAPYPAV